MKADLALGTSASVPAKLCRYAICNCLNPPTPVGAGQRVRISWESSASLACESSCAGTKCPKYEKTAGVWGLFGDLLLMHK